MFVENRDFFFPLKYLVEFACETIKFGGFFIVVVVLSI